MIEKEKAQLATIEKSGDDSLIERTKKLEEQLAANINVRAGFMDLCERTDKLETFVSQCKPTLDGLIQDSLPVMAEQIKNLNA